MSKLNAEIKTDSTVVIPECEAINITELKAEVEELKADLATANTMVAQLTSALNSKVDKADILDEEITSGTINADKLNFV